VLLLIVRFTEEALVVKTEGGDLLLAADLARYIKQVLIQLAPRRFVDKAKHMGCGNLVLVEYNIAPASVLVSLSFDAYEQAVKIIRFLESKGLSSSDLLVNHKDSAENELVMVRGKAAGDGDFFDSLADFVVLADVHDYRVLVTDLAPALALVHPAVRIWQVFNPHPDVQHGHANTVLQVLSCAVRDGSELMQRGVTWFCHDAEVYAT